jgi:serine/threonine protein kinase
MEALENIVGSKGLRPLAGSGAEPRLNNNQNIPLDLPQSLAFDYEFIRKIGEGSNGETWLIKNRANKSLAAIKCLKLNTAEDIKAVELFEREIQLLQSIQIDGIPKFYRYEKNTETGSSFLVQEYIDAPSIQTMLDNGYIFSESETLSIAMQIARILYQLQTHYSPPIIHRDIKPSNILYDKQHRAFLIDFGSVAHPQKRSGGSTIAGTFGYMPPEQLIGDVEIESDFYALGATMLHMITGVFPGTVASNVYQIEFSDLIDQKAPNTTPQMKALLSILLDADITKRPPSARVLMRLIHGVQEYGNAGIFTRIIRWIKSRLFSGRINILALSDDADSEPDKAQSPVSYPKSESPANHLATPIKTIKDYLNSDNRDYKCAKITKNWTICDGIIRKYHTAYYKENDLNYLPVETLEYTFFANDETRCGLFVLPKHSNFDIYLFPVPCRVIYNPSNPNRNAIYSIGMDGAPDKM